MTYFSNPTNIFTAITKLTHTMPVLIKEPPTIDKVVKSMGGYNGIGMVIKTADTTYEIHKSKKALVENYNLSVLLKEETRIFSLRRIKIQENLTKPNGLV